MSRLYLMRVVVDSGPGALARIGRAVETLHGTISTVDLQNGSSAHVGICDATVRLTDENATTSAVAESLRSASAGSLLAFGPTEEAVDPVLRAIRWACSIVGAGQLADDELQRVVSEICSTPDAWLLSLEEAANIESAQLAAERAESVLATTDDVPAMLEASFSGAAGILAVPDARLEPTAIAVVVKPIGQLFSATEIERVEAILALRRRASLLSNSVVDVDEGSWFDVSKL